MNHQLTKEAVQNALDSYKLICPELKNINLTQSDARCVKKLALCTTTNNSLQVLTDFMTYSEMNQFLRGYYFKAENRFKQEKTREYFIDEFYKFLESKEAGLSEKFNNYFTLLNKSKTLKKYLKEIPIEIFIFAAFNFEDTGNIDFWMDLSNDWRKHYLTIKD